MLINGVIESDEPKESSWEDVKWSYLPIAGSGNYSTWEFSKRARVMHLNEMLLPNAK